MDECKPLIRGYNRLAKLTDAPLLAFIQAGASTRPLLTSTLDVLPH